MVTRMSPFAAHTTDRLLCFEIYPIISLNFPFAELVCGNPTYEPEPPALRIVNGRPIAAHSYPWLGSVGRIHILITFKLFISKTANWFPNNYETSSEIRLQSFIAQFKLSTTRSVALHFKFQIYTKLRYELLFKIYFLDQITAKYININECIDTCGCPN